LGRLFFSTLFAGQGIFFSAKWPRAGILPGGAKGKHKALEILLYICSSKSQEV